MFNKANNLILAIGILMILKFFIYKENYINFIKNRYTLMYIYTYIFSKENIFYDCKTHHSNNTTNSIFKKKYI